jgi:glutathione synthase/RimK-type ligase-like ATP-grasp enzyme
VCEALVRRGATPVLFDGARPGEELALSSWLGAERPRAAAAGLALDEFSAVWRAGPLHFATPPRFTTAQARTTAASWEAALLGALESFDGFVLDPHARTSRAENKLYQLRLAQGLGLSVPPTLVSNEAAEVRAFARDRRVVLKLLVPQSFLREADGGDEIPVMWTTELTPAELERLPGLRHCPMIFQERIDKRRDVRVPFVAGRLFPVSVDPNIADHPHVDWRQDALSLKGHWRPHELPGDIRAALEALRMRLGLNYGAFDLIETPDGRHVFLEVNSFAVFSFLGAELAAPIAEAIAELLVAPPGAV